EQHQPSAVVSVCELHPHPFWAKKIDENGRLDNYFKHTPANLRRQDLTPAYALNGAIYLNRRIDLLKGGTMAPPAALPLVMPPWKSLDIDTMWEFEMAESILTRGLLQAA